MTQIHWQELGNQSYVRIPQRISTAHIPTACPGRVRPTDLIFSRANLDTEHCMFTLFSQYQLRYGNYLMDSHNLARVVKQRKQTLQTLKNWLRANRIGGYCIMKLGLSGWLGARRPTPYTAWGGVTSEAATPSYVPTVLYVTSGVNNLWKPDLHIPKPLFAWGKWVWVSPPPTLDFSLAVRRSGVRPADWVCRARRGTRGQRQRKPALQLHTVSRPSDDSLFRTLVYVWWIAEMLAPSQESLTSYSGTNNKAT